MNPYYVHTNRSFNGPPSTPPMYPRQCIARCDREWNRNRNRFDSAAPKAEGIQADFTVDNSGAYLKLHGDRRIHDGRILLLRYTRTTNLRAMT